MHTRAWRTLQGRLVTHRLAAYPMLVDRDLCGVQVYVFDTSQEAIWKRVARCGAMESTSSEMMCSAPLLKTRVYFEEGA